MKRQSRFCELLCVISLAAIGAPGWAGPAQAASDFWKADVAGNWSDIGSWTGGNIPGSTTVLNSADVATFGFTLATKDRIVTVDANRNIGTITFSHTSGKKYTLSGGSLLLSSGGVIQETSAASGAHTDTISSAIAIQGDGGTATFTAGGGTATTLLSIGAVTGVSAGANITTLTLNGTNTGANAITGIIGNGSAGGKLAIIKDGAGSWTLSGANTFTGGVTLSAGTLKINSNAALGTGTLDIGATSGSTPVTLDALGAHTIINAVNINQDFTYIGTSILTQGTGAVTLVNGTRTITVLANPLTVGGAIGDGGSGYGLTKLGAGTLTLDGSAVNTFTGGLSIYAGTLELDFTKLGTPTNLINGGNTLTLGSGTLSIKGNSTGSTSQTFSSLTVNGGGAILLKPTGADTTIPLGSIATVNSVGRSLLVGTVAGAGGGKAIITTTDNKDGQGIYGGRVVYTSDGGDTTDWATTVSAGSPYTFGAYGSYANLDTTSGTDTNNSRINAGATLGASRTTNSLKIESGGQTLALGANTLALTSGGLISTGKEVASTISGAAGATRLMGGNNGSGSYDLIVHQYNTGGLTISAVIGDNGANPTALTKSGAGVLILSGNNTYSGDTTINVGTLALSGCSTNNIASSPTINVGSGASLNVTGLSDGTLALGAAQTLKGNGTVTGGVTAQNGTKVAPGVSVGTMAITGNVTMGTGAIYEWQVASATGTPGTQWDLVTATNINLNGALVFKVDDSLFSGTISASNSFIVASATGTITTASSFTYSFEVPSGWSDAGATLKVSGNNLVLTGLTDSSVLPGDTNGDFVVDATDYIALKTNFGMTTGATLAQGNFNADIDGDVDWADLQILMANFGTRGVGGAPAVPEPGSVMLLMFGAAALLKRKRKS